MKKSSLETVTKTFQEVNCVDFYPPSKISFMNALGDHVYIKTKSREVGQKWVDDNYGKGKYKIKVME